MKVIDSIHPPRPQPRQLHRPTTPSAPSGAHFARLDGAPRKRRQVPWDAIIAALTSPLLFGLVFIGQLGELVVPAYGLIALFVRLPSRMHFVHALMALVFMTALQFNNILVPAQTMAVMAYEFLAIGAIAMAIEVRRDMKLGFRKKQRF